jgi:dUTP pyrophosphatase
MKQTQIPLKFKRLSQNFPDIALPAYATAGAAGMDIRAALMTELTLPHLGTALVPTDLAVEIPEGYELQVRPRSGLAAKHGVTILNAPGTIDADYRGEIKIILINFGQEDFVIKRGERIAQLVLAKTEIADVSEVTELSETRRAENGFGHTGRE